MKLKLGLIILTTLFIVSCAHSLHESQTSDFKGIAKGSRKVEGYGEQFVVMGFVQDTNYVNQAYKKIQDQCPTRITGITTNYWTSLGFFSWTNKIKMMAYCTP